MSIQKGQIKLGAFLMNTGHHVAAWRHPDAWAEHGLSLHIIKNWPRQSNRRSSTWLFWQMVWPSDVIIILNC